MRSKKQSFLKRLLAKLLVVVMVISMFPAIPVGATGDEATLQLTFSVSDANGPVPGASVTAGGEAPETTDSAGVATVSLTVTESGSVAYSVSKAGYDNVSGSAVYTYTAAEGDTPASAIAAPVNVTLVMATQDITATVNITDATVIAVDVDGIRATANGSGYTANVPVNTTHTATALIKQADGSYGTASAIASGTTIDINNTTTVIPLTPIPGTDASVTLDATTTGTSATSDKNLLVTWDALNLGTSGATTYTEETDTYDVASVEENGLLFTKPGTVTIKVQDLVVGTPISASTLTVTTVEVTVDKKNVTPSAVVMDVTPKSDKVGNTMTLTVKATMDGVSNYDMLQGELSWELTKESKKYATLDETDNTKLTLNSANNNADASVKLNVTVADSTFFGGVEKESNDITVERKDDTISISAISTDANVLNQIGVSVPATSSNGQTITYSVLNSDGTPTSVIQVEDGKLTVSDENIDAAAGTWTLQATVPGNTIYKQAEKSVTLTVGESAKFEKTPANDMTWLSDALTTNSDGSKTYSNVVVGKGEWTYAITAVYDHTAAEVTDESKWAETATINTATGDVTMKTAGGVTVTATRTKDNVKISYNLVVYKATLIPAFSSSSETLTYGKQGEYTLPLKVKMSEEGTPFAVPEDASVSWTLDDSTNGLELASPDTGFKVTLGNQTDTGSTVFKASVVADTHYQVISDKNTAAFTLNVEVPVVTELPESLDLSKYNNEAKTWYVPSEDKTAAKNAVFTAKTGYEISLNGMFKGDKQDWTESTTLADVVKDVDAEGKNLGKDSYVFIRETSTGAISKFKLPGYQVDNTNPTMTVSFSEPVATALFKGITSIFYNWNDNSDLRITIEADDTVSDIQGVAWKLEEEADTAYRTMEYQDGKYVSVVRENIDQKKLKFRATNNAGLITETMGVSGYDDSPVVVVDSIVPGLKVTYEGTLARYSAAGKVVDSAGDADTIVFADNDVTVTITVDETYFDAKRFSAKINGQESALSWTTDKEEPNLHTAQLKLVAEKNKDKLFNLIVSGNDIANNAIVDAEDADTSLGSVEKGQYTSKTILIDSTTPTATVSYNDWKNRVDDKEIPTKEEDKAVTAVYSDAVIATVNVTEAYFDPTNQDDWKVTVKEDGNTFNGFTCDWTGNTATITIPEKDEPAEHIYTVTVTGTDIAKHPFTYTSVMHGSFKNEAGKYESKELLIDTKAPEVFVDYTNTANSGAKEGFFTSRSATVSVTDASFDPSKTNAYYQVSGVNAVGHAVDTSKAAMTAWSGGNGAWNSSIAFITEANYTFGMSLNDNAGNPAKFTTSKDESLYVENGSGAYQTKFTVDQSAPEKMTFEYSQPVSDALISGIFYRFYNHSTVFTVTVKVEDEISGVQTMSYTYDRAAGASTINEKQITREYGTYSNADGNANTYIHGLGSISETDKEIWKEGQLNGDFSYTVMDYAGNIRNTSDAAHTEEEHVPDSAVREVVDTIWPEATISYSGFTNSSTTANHENPDGDLAYYFQTSSLSVPITITEANFYPEDVEVSVSRNGSDFQPVSVSWTASGQDVYSCAVNLSEADSYYYIHVSYKDRSDNSMQTADKTNSAYSKTDGSYVSPRLVLDTTAPVVTASYSGSFRSSDMDYYNSTAVATIRVKEKNFSAAEATSSITISGQNIDGGATGVPAVSGWTYVGDDTYSATITYSADSRYTFDMNYSDLAVIRQSTSVKKTFTVDMTPPTNLAISYSTDVWGLATGSILWYDAPVSVTLTASDLTAGVESITYSYPTKNGVSTVNVGMGDVTVGINANTSTATYTFQIPSSVLISTNQFDGSIIFKVTDRSGNSTSYNGTEELVVDNIAPNATITFTEPVSSDDDTDYYSGAFDAKIEINEANFNADDVRISVTKDGQEYTSFTYSFVDESVDIHTATIHFTENGEYVIVVSYTDQSKNELVGEELVANGTYTSRKKIIDLNDPEVLIEDMRGNENPNEIAYNDDEITFTVSFKDENLLSDGLNVTLKSFRAQSDDEAAKQDLSGYDYSDENEYVQSPVTLAEGEEYSIKIQNVEKDAVYFLDCNATDQAGRDNSAHAVFSVNRDGSTYFISDDTSKLCNSYTNHTSEVEIHEINVENLIRKGVSVIRDANSSVLKEGTEFSVATATGKDQHWNDYTYTVFDSNFEREGVYTVQTNSTTEITEQESSSSNSGLEIKFVMDTTEPEAYINGIVDNERYDSSEQPVTISVTDNVRLASAELYVDGVVLASETFDNASGTIETSIPEKNGDQKVHVVAYDEAGNTYSMNDITVRITSNPFFLYLEYWIIGGIVVLLMFAILIGVIISRKKKTVGV